MQVIPDQKNSKTTALLLLAIAVLMVYLVFFHWFVLRHKAYAEEIGDLRDQLTRFQTVAAQRGTLQERLGEIRNSQEDAGLFLDYPSFDEAAAAISGSIGDMVNLHADGSCQIVSRQPVRSRVQERFEKITVNVRMRCNAEDFLKVLYSMENNIPLMLVDDLNAIRPRTRSRSTTRQSQTQSAGTLDIRFNVSGYLR